MEEDSIELCRLARSTLSVDLGIPLSTFTIVSTKDQGARENHVTPSRNQSLNMPTAGLFYVTAQPSADLSLDVFHDWYNKEHGPARVKLPFITTGLRYQANDGKKPEWLALYDLTDVSEMKSSAYTSLAENASANEQEIKKSLELDRKVYELQFSKGEVPNGPAKFRVVLRRVFKDEAYASEYAKWFKEEHVGLLEKIPGWQRSRTFKLSEELHGEGKEPVYYLTMHEYTHLEDMQETMKKTKGLSTEWKSKVDEMLSEKMVREWQFYHDLSE